MKSCLQFIFEQIFIWETNLVLTYGFKRLGTKHDATIDDDTVYKALVNKKAKSFSHLPAVTNKIAKEILNNKFTPSPRMKILREQIIDTYNNNNTALEHLREIKERQMSFEEKEFALNLGRSINRTKLTKTVVAKMFYTYLNNLDLFVKDNKKDY